MDVERTMEFILQMQAKAEVRMAKAEARMEKAEARMDKFDRRLEAMRKLVETGMRWLVKIEKSHHELAEQGKALQEAQRRSDRKFERLMEILTKQRSNGHGSRN